MGNYVFLYLRYDTHALPYLGLIYLLKRNCKCYVCYLHNCI